MKPKHLIIIFFALLLSCNSKKEEELNIIVHRLRHSTDLIRAEVDMLFSQFENWRKSNEDDSSGSYAKIKRLGKESQSLQSYYSHFLNYPEKEPSAAYKPVKLKVSPIPRSNKYSRPDEEKGSKIITSSELNRDSINDKIIKYKDFLLSLIDDKEINNKAYTTIQKLLDYKQENTKTRLIDLCILHNRIKNAEFEIIKYLFNQVNDYIYEPNMFEIVVNPKKTILKPGEEYKAEIFLAAIDTFIDLNFILNNDTTKLIKGKAYIESDKKIENFEGRFEYKSHFGHKRTFKTDSIIYINN